MALYRYVPGREGLLDGVVERGHRRRSYGDPDVLLESRHGWQDYLQRLAPRRPADRPGPPARSSRWSPPARRPHPWVRPPLRSLRLVESFLDTLHRRRVLRRRRGRRLPGLHQLPARPPAAGGHPARRAGDLARRAGGRPRQAPRARSTSPPTTRTCPPRARCSGRTSRRRSSRRPWRACSTGSTLLHAAKHGDGDFGQLT